MASELEQAIAAIKAGDREKGRWLLSALIKDEPDNELAWQWLASVVESDEQRRYCVNQLLKINPESSWARQNLEALADGGSLSKPPMETNSPHPHKPETKGASEKNDTETAPEPDPVNAGSQANPVARPDGVKYGRRSSGLLSRMRQSNQGTLPNDAAGVVSEEEAPRRTARLEDKLARQNELMLRLIELHGEQSKVLKSIDNNISGLKREEGCTAIMIFCMLLGILFVFSGYFSEIVELMRRMKLY